MSRTMTRRFVVGCLLLTACVSRVYCPAGVAQVQKTYSFCHGDLKIPMDLECDNVFLIRDKPLARVSQKDTTVWWPFKFVSGDGTMQILEGVSFTHRSLCERPDNLVEEVLTDYHYQDFCSRLNHGSALQGRPLAVLVGVALVFVLLV